ncbi:helix-turn-helix transcriptional regulator [Streptomyces sp. JJ66]|uniref:helix-turn-helix transcriptional regulator n=1 Tax=Streptomyces sp. JJ66 TaxID=2803843 RepID=UPI001C599BF9|nr:helix-turn-helix transcriptional regulator [Streptomyces sp. JJ66]MBW1601006.1 helix-turn-helix transcriptional regulator [Streptomyces sp. JJ66]
MEPGDYTQRPSALGGGTVVWARAAADQPGSALVLPDGCMDLIWHDGLLLVAGPDSRAQAGAERPGDRWTGLRFAPGTGPAVLGVPAHELRDQRVPLDALWPGARVRRLTEYVAGAADRGAALEAVAASVGAVPDPLARAVAAALDAGRTVADVARAAHLSPRQLHRRSLDAFGYGPKTLARVLRLQRALASAYAGRALADVAVHAGYADQAHLSREVRALAGVPLTRLPRPTG